MHFADLTEELGLNIWVKIYLRYDFIICYLNGMPCLLLTMALSYGFSKAAVVLAAQASFHFVFLLV